MEAEIYKLTVQDCKLLNLRDLSLELNVRYDYVKDMKKVGFPMPFGGRTTLTLAVQWLNKHPNFREDARLLKLSNRPKLRAHPQRPNAGKSGEPRLRNGSRSSARHSLVSQHELAA